MNALQAFIASHPCGFLGTSSELADDLGKLIAIDRLCPVLVRCGACRFTCAAQYVSHLMHCIGAGGDYVRDVSFPVGSQERAASWQPQMPEHARQRLQRKVREVLQAKPQRERIEGQDWIATGNFDGFTCGTDADPGL